MCWQMNSQYGQISDVNVIRTKDNSESSSYFNRYPQFKKPSWWNTDSVWCWIYKTECNPDNTDSRRYNRKYYQANKSKIQASARAYAREYYARSK